MPDPQSCEFPVFSYQTDVRGRTLEDFSYSIDQDCSVWRWCPISPFESPSYDYRESSECSEDDLCVVVADSGRWSLVCGDECLGPPPVAGRFYGETIYICHCPSYEFENYSSAIFEDSVEYEYPSLSCYNDLDEPPFPFNFEWNKVIRPAAMYPEIRFYSDCTDPDSSTRAAWTWCPIEDYTVEHSCYPEPYTVTVWSHHYEVPDAVVGDYEGSVADGFQGETYLLWYDDDASIWRITLSEEDEEGWEGPADSVCPYGVFTPTSGVGAVEVTAKSYPLGTQMGDSEDCVAGRWVFRGGCKDLGPPPVDGRFLGETVFVGYCCFPPESEEYDSSLEWSSTGLCDDMPPPPAFKWLMEIDPLPDEMYKLVEPPEVPCADPCVGWLWCPCSDDPENSECLQLFDGVYKEPGLWQPLDVGDMPDPQVGWGPCVQGRFFGEILYFCECPVSVSSSSSSQCTTGRMYISESTAEGAEGAVGYYDLIDNYNGLPHFSNGSWNIWGEYDPIANQTDWYVTSSAAGTTPPDEPYYKQSVGIGSFPSGYMFDLAFVEYCQIVCCADTLSLESCPETYDITIAFAGGTCIDEDGEYTLTKGSPPNNWSGGGETAGFTTIDVVLDTTCGLWRLIITLNDGPSDETKYVGFRPGSCPPTGTWEVGADQDEIGCAATPTVTLA